MKLFDKVLIISFSSLFTIFFIGQAYQNGTIGEMTYEVLLFSGPIVLALSMIVLKRVKTMMGVYIAIYFTMFSYITSLLFVHNMYQNFLEHHPNFQILLIIFLFSTLLYPVFDIVNNELYLMFNNTYHETKSNGKYDTFVKSLRYLSIISYFLIIVIGGL